MARQKGVSTFVKISVQELIAKLGNYPNVEVAVSKGNLAEIASVLGVKFSVSESVAAVSNSEVVTDDEGESNDSALGGLSVE